MSKYNLMTKEGYMYILRHYHELVDEQGEKIETFLLLGYHEVFFIKNFVDNATHHSEYVLFQWCFQIYINFYDETGILPYRKQINIFDDLLNNEWFFYESYTRDMLSTLKNMDTIIFCDFKEDCFFLNLEKETLLHFLTNRERISTGKYPIAIEEYIINQPKRNHLRLIK